MKPYYYIYRVGGNAPTVKHNTLEEAEREALRLAQQHPESTFEILQCVGISRMTKPSVFWMDGVFPADIKEPEYRDLEVGELYNSLKATLGKNDLTKWPPPIKDYEDLYKKYKDWNPPKPIPYNPPLVYPNYPSSPTYPSYPKPIEIWCKTGFQNE